MRNKILLIKLWAIGEVALSTPCIARLKASFPNSDIYFLVGDCAKDIISGNPAIKKIYSVDEDMFLKLDMRRLFLLILELRRERFDIVVTLHHFSFFSLFAFLISAPRRLGFKRPGSWSLNTADIVSNGATTPKISDYLKVLELLAIPSADKDLAISIYPNEEDKTHLKKLMGESGLVSKRFVILSPTGGENPPASVLRSNIKNKIWPLEYYRELCGLIVNRIGFKVALAGGVRERDKALYIRKGFEENVADLTGKINLRELRLLAEEAAISVTNDSGPMAVISSSASPLIAIFGPTDPRLICQPGGNFIVMREGLTCSPCYDGSAFPNRIKDCEDPVCIRSITPKKVFQKMREILNLP